MPAPRFAFLDWPAPIAFAHRGGGNEFPGNTMKAFEGSVALGYHYLETDVQVTSDGVLVTFHDDTLDGTTDHVGTISNLPWSVVQQARVGGTEPIPKLEDVLEAFPQTRFNIEPKTDAAVDSFIEIIRATGALDRICAGSFSNSRLKKIRAALGPTLCTGMGVGDTARLRIGSWLPFGGLSKLIAHTDSACTQVPVKQGPVTVTDKRLVSLSHRSGRGRARLDDR